MNSVCKKITLVYIINLPERKGRFKHIQSQSKNKNEFEVMVMEASKNPQGSLGLWYSIEFSFVLRKLRI